MLVRLELIDLRERPEQIGTIREQGLRPLGIPGPRHRPWRLLYGIACRRRERTRDAGFRPTLSGLRPAPSLATSFNQAGPAITGRSSNTDATRGASPADRRRRLPVLPWSGLRQRQPAGGWCSGAAPQPGAAPTHSHPRLPIVVRASEPAWEQPQKPAPQRGVQRPQHARHPCQADALGGSTTRVEVERARLPARPASLPHEPGSFRARSASLPARTLHSPGGHDVFQRTSRPDRYHDRFRGYVCSNIHVETHHP